MVSIRWTIERNRPSTVELQSARVNQRNRRLSGPVGKSVVAGVDAQARFVAEFRICDFDRVASGIKKAARGKSLSTSLWLHHNDLREAEDVFEYFWTLPHELLKVDTR
jgi:hypothetical protein